MQDKKLSLSGNVKIEEGEFFIFSFLKVKYFYKKNLKIVNNFMLRKME